ncbi:siderophore-interacting protein [Streptomyces sp. NBC_01476]|uniref:siderophore-interacting protein n=1 Tax=Streptomyces sp. NBC_01476 TaxID=2903881 RepID=UPI002E33AC71|nr:siderophore-interacting protein [Streptomyces sp. NBC_01476]
MGHGWEGVVLKLIGARNFTFTVTATQQVTPRFHRLRLTDGGLLAALGTHPTMWVRLWFEHQGRPHQRAYTITDPDPGQGTIGLEFALHDGPAADWARAAEPGDTITATVYGTGFTAPAPPPSRLILIGDPASLPAVNSLLDALPDVPATIWFETPDPADEALELRADPVRHEVRRVPRRDAGGHLVAEVRNALPGLIGDPVSAYVWIACDTATTRKLTRFVRSGLGVPKERVKAMGYWQAT